MDTGTHIVMGIAIGGIATLDPTVVSGTSTAQAIMAGAIIGSQAPDLDTVLKLKNNAKYIRNHRGITHSIPAVILWPLIISGSLYLIFPEANLFHLWIWTFLAVILHVFVDIFNAYGTQALRPFSKKWIALGVINTFDPFIFGAHITGIVAWSFGSPPGITFALVFTVLVIYYLLRFRAKYVIYEAAHEKIDDILEVIISPTMRFHKWHLAITTKNHFHVAKGYKNQVTIVDTFERTPIPDNEIMRAAVQDDNLSAFLSFSPVYRWEVDEYNDHYEVRFIDLRYRSKGYYPFVAVVQLDEHLNIASSYTGWIFSEKKLMSKLDIAPE